MLTKLTITSTQDGAQGFDLPASMLAGNHTLVVTGTAADGKAAQMKVGIMITAPTQKVLGPVPAAASSSSTNWLWWMLPFVALAAFAPLLFIVWRRRRREDEGAVA